LGLVGPHAGPEVTGADNIAQHLFKGEAVTLKHGKEKAGEHEANHQEQRGAVTDVGAGKQVGGDTDYSRDGETDKLAFCQIKRQLGLDFG